jgi:uncharacterized membrane protein
MLLKIAYTVALLMALDMIWFQVSVPSIYGPVFNKINGTSGYINIPSALVSWLLIALLINRFAENAQDAFILGFLSYGIYNATNYATIKHWSLKTVIFDTLWGGSICFIVFNLLKRFGL